MLVLDLKAGVLYQKTNLNFRLDNEDDQLWWDSFREELVEHSGRSGGSEFFEMLQSSASNFLTVSDAAVVQTDNPVMLLDCLYADHVPG